MKIKIWQSHNTLSSSLRLASKQSAFARSLRHQAVQRAPQRQTSAWPHPQEDQAAAVEVGSRPWTAVRKTPVVAHRSQTGPGADGLRASYRASYPASSPPAGIPGPHPDQRRTHPPQLNWRCCRCRCRSPQRSSHSASRLPSWASCRPSSWPCAAWEGHRRCPSRRQRRSVLATRESNTRLPCLSCSTRPNSIKN